MGRNSGRRGQWKRRNIRRGGAEEGEGQSKGSDRGRRKTEEEEDSRKGRKLSGRGSNVHLNGCKKVKIQWEWEHYKALGSRLLDIA